MKILIRNAKEEDLNAIVEFQLKMAKETENLTLDRDIVRKGVANLFADERRGLYWVAESDEQIIGGLMTNYEWSDWRNGNVVWIQSVFIVPEKRGKGVFKAMYQHLKTWVTHNESLMGLRLYVDKTNTKAQKVYEAMGMSAEHYAMYEWLK